MSATTLLELACPRCRGELPADSGARVFVCAECQTSWTATSGPTAQWTEVARQVVAPRLPLEPGAPLHFLPLWIVRLRTDEMGGIGPRMPREIRVPGFGLGRLPLVVQFARNLTRSPQAWTEASELRIAPESAELEAADAFALAELVVLRHVDGWPPEDEETRELPLGGARLLDWPFTRRGHELIDLVGGLSLHVGALGDREPRDLASRLDLDVPRVEPGR